MKEQIKARVPSILVEYTAKDPRPTADALRAFWREFEPKSVAGIKAELRQVQETVGTPVPVLTAIGKEVAKEARKDVDGYLPLASLLWREFGREGKNVAVMPLGAMELVEPERMLPLLKDLCRSCVTWEDADRFSMNALEPVVRKDPETWLSCLAPWLDDDNKWVRRAAVTAVGRLPMKKPAYTARCLEMTETLLYDGETDVKKAVSFAIRLGARGEPEAVCAFLACHVPPQNLAATWVLCDAIRSMTKRFLPHFAGLLPHYERWAADPDLSARDRRSVESAVRILRKGLND